MPEGRIVVMRTSFFPIKVKLKLFFYLALVFEPEHPNTVHENANREIAYVVSAGFQVAILPRYPPMQFAPAKPQKPPQGRSVSAFKRGKTFPAAY